ncbi:hypothetical protein ANACOL_02349 [Anaerotruncus colihominis DSM 17241]|uniref:Uncharacterized protein n=1 Tax=Anaerotruncus colihominis DSM 17241 TaxID=445972 RepID=B0PC39_9FIRM|nr:hypothetical protein ANACOL_02349 [Anaerotruncus colihominis DSM 17241]
MVMLPFRGKPPLCIYSVPFPPISSPLSGLFEKRPQRKTLIGCAPAFLKKGLGEKL